MDDDKEARAAIRAAIQEGGVKVSEEVQRDLARLGHTLPPGVKVEVVSYDDPDTVVVCVQLDLDHPRIRLDNKDGFCSFGCGRRIQFRPYLPDHVRKICVPCALAKGDTP